jgi:hypothetical protein
MEAPQQTNDAGIPVLGTCLKECSQDAKEPLVPHFYCSTIAYCRLYINMYIIIYTYLSMQKEKEREKEHDCNNGSVRGDEREAGEKK